MKTWLVWGDVSLPQIEIKADNFDKAIEEARKIDKKYYLGQLKENE